MSTAELFIEVRSEEIPAGMQTAAAKQLLDNLTNALKSGGIAFGNAVSHSTPRRIVAVIESVEADQPARTEEKKGPREGSPDKAFEGFLRANGLDSLDQAEKRETDKGVFFFAVKQIEGQQTINLLPDLVAKAIADVGWPKSMRWARNNMRWVRPLQSIIALFDGQIIDGRLEVGADQAVAFGNTSYGHRFLGPNPIKVSDFANYQRKLLDQKVVLDRAERRKTITEQLASEASKRGVSVIDDPGLLEEVVGLVEWPVVIVGAIDDEFMGVPKEVLTTSMREHQKFFAFTNADGSLAPLFATVANITPQDDGTTIASGNERVLRARLSDAKFFWEQDLAIPLDSLTPKLEKVIFHEKLGSVGEKVERMKALAADIAGQIGGDASAATKAASLCKGDLMSSMVYEFPELQGTMGQYYAQKAGEAADVSNAIAEHYSPLGPDDACPTHNTSVAVALADKLDTLTGFWFIDEKPTGSKDPFALRRAALGCIRLIEENGHHLPFKALALSALAGHDKAAKPEIVDDLWRFIKDRLKVQLRNQEIRHDVVEAIYAAGDDDDITRVVQKAKAVNSFLASEQGKALEAGTKRAESILAAESKKHKASYDGSVDPALFVDEAEKSLNKAIDQADEQVAKALKDDAFDSALNAMADVRPAVDQFFEDVLVNAEEANIRLNRLHLLNRLGSLVGRIADTSKLQG